MRPWRLETAQMGLPACRPRISICCCQISACPSWTASNLTHQASAAFPAMKILLMTGYAEQRERADDLADKIVDVISKPFSLPDIRKAVALALAA